MIRVPGRKERGVIFTTVTELPPYGRLERKERERPSGSGLERSKDETADAEKKSKGPKEGNMRRKQQEEKGEEKKNQEVVDTTKYFKIVETDMKLEADTSLNVENAILLVFAQHNLHTFRQTVCEQVRCQMWVLGTGVT